MSVSISLFMRKSNNSEGFTCKSNDIMLKRRSFKIYTGFIYILVLTVMAVRRDSLVDILITRWMVREWNPEEWKIQTGPHSFLYNG